MKSCQVKGCDALKDMLVHVKTNLYNGVELKQKRSGCRSEVEDKENTESGVGVMVSKAML